MKTRAQKEITVQTIKDKLAKSKSVVFTDYKGLNMVQLGLLRDQLRSENAEFNITKNTLLEKALVETGLPVSDEIKSGPTATLFAYQDQISPIKILVKILKDAQIGQIKVGLFDGELMDKFSLIKLSQLPSQDELRAKVVDSLSAPLYGIVGVLNANLRNLVYAVNQIRISKGGE